MVSKASLKGVLVLSDGSSFTGDGFGAEGTACGELVFNTAMTGYQESLTDPSYAGQILMPTYPLIGNYGVSKDDFESGRIHVSAYVVREYCGGPSHRHSHKTIDKFLHENGIPGLCGIDTREIVRKIRTRGVMPAALSVYDARGPQPDVGGLLAQAKKVDYSSINFVEMVSVKKRQDFEPHKGQSCAKRVALIDCGVKMSIVRELLARGISVTLLPWNATPNEIRSCEPAGLAISNGPGDPALLTGVAHTVKQFFGEIPIFGICLGHQILGHAAGGRTYKLKFGHRGANHPVKDGADGRILITSQNHGFAVDADSLPQDFVRTFTNLNDKTNEGMRHRSLPIFSVQFHPEANCGPYDTEYLFDEFKAMLEAK